MINGELSPKFKPERGIRQGDPLSPYLFVLVTEILSFLIQKEAACGLLEGVTVTANAPKETHLFFADDSLLFGRVNSVESKILRRVLAKYGEASGQQINFEKSNVMFSSNTV